MGIEYFLIFDWIFSIMKFAAWLAQYLNRNKLINFNNSQVTVDFKTYELFWININFTFSFLQYFLKN